MKVKFLYITLAFLLFTNFYANAQVWNLRLGIGLMSYNGDLVTSVISLPNAHAAIRLGFGVEVYPRLGVEISYLRGNVSSKNVENIDPAKFVNFSSPIDNYSLLIKYRLDKMNIHSSRFGLSLLLGGGIFMFDPIENVNGTQVILSENQREGVAYSLQENEFNLGLEFSYMITRKWVISLQSIYHFTSTDYLDDVSIRKNPKNNDAYMDNTISAIYRFGSEKAFKRLQDPMKCPAFLK